VGGKKIGLTVSNKKGHCGVRGIGGKKKCSTASGRGGGGGGGVWRGVCGGGGGGWWGVAESNVNACV